MKERRIIRTIIVNERKKYTSDRHSSRYGTGRDRAAKRPYRPCTGSDRPEYEGTKGTITTSRTTRRRVGVGAASFVSLFGSGCLGGLTGDDGYEHERDDPPCEWGGLYELESGTYTYTYREGPDPDMRLAFVLTERSSEHALFHAGETATELFEQDGTETVVTDGDAVPRVRFSNI